MVSAPKPSPFETVTWDESKRVKNIAKHHIDFTQAEYFDYATALIGEDDRFDYGECREVALGFIGARLHVLVFTQRGTAMHVISLRKANRRETKAYAKTI